MAETVGFVHEALQELLGEWNPIAEGEHFAGIDVKYVVGACVVMVVLGGLFGIVRACFRR